MSARKHPRIQRPVIDIAAATGGWPDPWPNVAEIAGVLPADKWTLVGGLMTQLHSIHHGLGVVRPTNDVDIVLHVETSRGVAGQTQRALHSLGYDLRPAVDPRHNTAHRFYRGTSKIDVVTDHPAEEPQEVVDVLVADHHAPKVTQRLAGRAMVRIEGGTQALRRTINARLQIVPGTITTISVPGAFGALILKPPPTRPTPATPTATCAMPWPYSPASTTRSPNVTASPAPTDPDSKRCAHACHPTTSRGPS